MARKIYVNWDEQPLGLVSDEELAKKLNVNRTTVGFHRRKKDIKTYFERFGYLGIDWEAQPLGVISDRELARRLGVRPSAVQRRRSRLGIKPKYMASSPPLILSLNEAKLLQAILTQLMNGTDLNVLLKRREFGPLCQAVFSVRQRIEKKHKELENE